MGQFDCWTPTFQTIALTLHAADHHTGTFYVGGYHVTIEQNHDVKNV